MNWSCQHKPRAFTSEMAGFGDGKSPRGAPRAPLLWDAEGSGF